MARHSKKVEGGSGPRRGGEPERSVLPERVDAGGGTRPDPDARPARGATQPGPDAQPQAGSHPEADVRPDHGTQPQAGSHPAHGRRSRRGADGRKPRRRRLPRWADRLITALVILVGVGLMVWPWVLDRIEASGVFNQISQVSQTIDALSPEDKQRYLQQAQAYNAQLAGETPQIDPSQILPYDEQLTYDRDPMMSWVEIPSINVSMPIYHGTSDAVLMAGVGHLEGSSLPVGGSSTHCVLTAHSGMQNLRMFDDIRQLQPGDIVLLHTMGDTLAYQVQSSEVVWPDQVSSLAIEPGKDLLTLVTCTPYGINDHRLLVHCVRTTYDPQQAADQASVTKRHWGAREWAVLVVALAAVGLTADVVVHRVRRRGGDKPQPR
ncbi:MAG: class C sortase [Olsenella sp.]|nr:class C sortase [Olsenella sp.]